MHLGGGGWLTHTVVVRFVDSGNPGYADPVDIDTASSSQVVNVGRQPAAMIPGHVKVMGYLTRTKLLTAPIGSCSPHDYRQ